MFYTKKHFKRKLNYLTSTQLLLILWAAIFKEIKYFKIYGMTVSISWASCALKLVDWLQA